MDEKKINKKKQEVLSAQEERERLKVIYDSSIIILEGQRKTVRELESRSNTHLENFLKADNEVKKKIQELSEVTYKLEENGHTDHT